MPTSSRIDIAVLVPVHVQVSPQERLRDAEYKRRCQIELLVFNLQQSLYPPKCTLSTEKHLKGCLRCFMVRRPSLLHHYHRPCLHVIAVAAP